MQSNLIRNLILVLFILVLISPLTTISSEQSHTTSFTPPIFIYSTLNPLKAFPGNQITITANIFDFFGIKKVQCKFFHEKGFDEINLSLISGSIQHGIWQCKWNVHDTIVKEYNVILTAFSNSGSIISKNHIWWDPEVPWWNSDFLYRKQINFIEPQGLTRTNTHVLFSVDLDQNRLSDENGAALVYNGEQIPYDGYAISTENGWITKLEGLAEINISSWETKTCYLYYDPVNSATEIFPINTGWSYVGAIGYSGVNYVDLDPVDIDCFDDDPDGEFTNLCGEGNNLKLNEWSYFKPPQTGNLYFKTGSDEGSGLWLNNTLIVSDNNGEHGVQWRDSPAQNLITGRYYALEIDWAEDKGGQALYNRWDTSAGDDSNGNVIDDEAYPFYGDEWLINVNINNSEEIAPLSKPELKSPQNNSYTQDTTPTFQWNLSQNADNYTVIVDNESDLSNGDEWINISLSSSTDSYTIPAVNALSEERWYWMVVANNSRRQNSSDIFCFIVDITPPLSSNLSSPADNAVIDNNQVTFSWNSTKDDTSNTSQVSDISCYQLQVGNNQDFSSPFVNENTSDNSTFSLMKTVAGKLYWRVRAWDQAGNPGSFSEIRTLTVFNFSLRTSSTTIQIQRGSSGSTTLSVEHLYGDIENISFDSYWSGTIKASSVDVSFNPEQGNGTFDSTITFSCGSSATTGTFTCTVNSTSASGIKKTVNIIITVYSMLFSVDGFPRTLSLIRSDSTTSTISVEFDQGSLEVVYLTGIWIGETPSGVSVSYSINSGTPPYDSTVTISTSSSAEAGNFVYRVTGTGSGLTKTVNLYVNILTDLFVTVATDKNSYEKGQRIQISGVVRDENNDLVGSGTTNILLSAQNWHHSFTTQISNGVYETSYYITFDKPDGNWIISVTATDSRGHITSSSSNISIVVSSPELYNHYSINIISPVAGQLFKRGEIITFTVYVNENTDKIVGVKVQALTSFGEVISFSEVSPGIYSTNYYLEYSSPIGNWNLNIEGTKFEEEKLKAGFNHINFEVQPIKPILELIKPKTSTVEVGETIQIVVEIIYPDGTPLEEGVVTAVSKVGEILLFSKTGTNLYTSSYTPNAESIGNWKVEVKVEDAYGNSAVLTGENIEIIHTKATSYIFRYWWVICISCFAIISIGFFLAYKKIRKVKLRNLKLEIFEFERMKKEKAIQYFINGEISRQTYDLFFKEYESKIADLTKKTRILERKMKKKKSLNKRENEL